MGKTSLSLPDEMLIELELAAEKNGRTFSGEVRFRLVELDILKTTGVAKITTEATKEISGDSERITEEEIKDLIEKLEPVVEQAKADVANKALGRLDKVGKFEGVSKLAKKIASEIPGVRLASEVGSDFNPTAEEIAYNERDEKSEKSRAKETKDGKVSLTKGFWREEYASVEEAEAKAVEMGWAKSEYKIEEVI